jgi:hypothetical protein
MYSLAATVVQGHSHKRADPPVPCQDAGRGFFLPNGYPAIVVADGAGSSSASHLASAFCVEKLSEACAGAVAAIEKIGTFSTATDIDKGYVQDQWHVLSRSLFADTRQALMDFAARDGHANQHLYCTMILVIRTPAGFLSANIGDGRAGYYNGQEAKPLIVPFMTFTAGATYFLIKEGWESVFRSYASFDEQADYFFASTDGCQQYLIDGSQKGTRTGIYDDVLGDEAYYDYNRPYHPFLGGVVASLKEAADETERNMRLLRLVEQGLYILNGEERELKSVSDPALDDDKTLVVFYK